MRRSYPEGAQSRKPQDPPGRISSHRPACDPRPSIFRLVLCPAQPNARRVGADQGCGPASYHATQPLNQPSRRTLDFAGAWAMLAERRTHARKCCGPGVCRCLILLDQEFPAMGHCGQKGSRDLSRKCCRKPKAGLIEGLKRIHEIARVCFLDT